MHKPKLSEEEFRQRMEMVRSLKESNIVNEVFKLYNNIDILNTPSFFEMMYDIFEGRDVSTWMEIGLISKDFCPVLQKFLSNISISVHVNSDKFPNEQEKCIFVNELCEFFIFGDTAFSFAFFTFEKIISHGQVFLYDHLVDTNTLARDTTEQDNVVKQSYHYSFRSRTLNNVRFNVLNMMYYFLLTAHGTYSGPLVSEFSKALLSFSSHDFLGVRTVQQLIKGIIQGESPFIAKLLQQAEPLLQSLPAIKDVFTDLSHLSTHEFDFTKKGIDKSIKIIKQMGAASLAEAFLVNVHKDGRSQQGVMKVIKPKALLQLSLEIFNLELTVNSQMEFNTFHPNLNRYMKYTMKQINRETDVNIEKKNIELGHTVYSSDKVTTVTCLEIGDNPFPYIVMTFGGNVPLSKLLDENKVTESIIDSYNNLVFLWLSSAFLGTGFVHCDLHPGNVLVSEDSKLCLIDFGYCTLIPRELRKQLKDVIWVYYFRPRRVVTRILEMMIAVCGIDVDDPMQTRLQEVRQKVNNKSSTTGLGDILKMIFEAVSDINFCFENDIVDFARGLLLMEQSWQRMVSQSEHRGRLNMIEQAFKRNAGFTDAVKFLIS